MRFIPTPFCWICSPPILRQSRRLFRQRATRLRDYLARVTDVELGRAVDVLENGSTPVKECLYTVFEEEFEHNRYASRDLAFLE